MNETSGRVKAIAIRTGDRAPVRELTEARAVAGQGLVGDDRAGGKRGITLLDARRWADTMSEMGKDLPWHTRRANVLVEGMNLRAALVGKRLRIGEVEVHVWDETRPCGEMDEMCPGLRDALKPDTRGGLHGEILTEGQIQIGDEVTILVE